MARKAAVMEVEAEAVDEILVVVDDRAVAEIDILALDEEACRQRAYEISKSADAGTPDENWLGAEAGLRGTLPANPARPGRATAAVIVPEDALQAPICGRARTS